MFDFNGESKQGSSGGRGGGRRRTADNRTNERGSTAAVKSITKPIPKMEEDMEVDFLQLGAAGVVQEVKRIFYEDQKRFIIEEMMGMNENKGYIYRGRRELGGEKFTLVFNDYWNTPDDDIVGHTVNIVNAIEVDSTTLEVNRKQGYLILNPDQLIPITTVVDSILCTRRAVFKNRINGPGVTIEMLRGNIAHEMTQVSMSVGARSKKEIREIGLNAIKSAGSKTSAYEIGLTQAQLIQLAEELVAPVQVFMQKRWIGAPLNGDGRDWEMLELYAIEETHWSPIYGLKGKVDASVKIRNRLNGVQEIIPLELKTGKEPKEVVPPPKSTVTYANYGEKPPPKKQQINDYGGLYVAQVSMYNLLMEHLKPEIGSSTKGMVYTIRDNGLLENESRTLILKQMVHARNQLIMGLKINPKTGQFVHLPDPTVDTFICSRCPLQTICGLNIRTGAKDVAQLNTTENTILSFAKHLSKAEADFFEKQLRSLYLEIETQEDHTANIWKVDPFERMNTGTCLAGLMLLHQTRSQDFNKQSSDEYDAHSVHLTLTLDHQPNAEESFKRAQFFEREFVLLGTNREPVISYAYIHEINPEKKTVTLLLEDAIGQRHLGSNVSFSIDKNARMSSWKILPGYILQVLFDTPETKRIRDLLMGKLVAEYPKEEIVVKSQEVGVILRAYNKKQMAVIMRSLSMKSFLCVRGVEGTGKTETIVGLLRGIIASGETALVVTNTPATLNKILMKLEPHCTSFIRVGSACEEELQPYQIFELGKGENDVDKLREIYNSRKIVGTTMTNLGHSIFSVRKFTYCIFAEVTEVAPPAIYGALMLAEKYTFFGDTQKTPRGPSSEAKSLGLPTHLFEMISNKKNTIVLTERYSK